MFCSRFVQTEWRKIDAKQLFSWEFAEAEGMCLYEIEEYRNNQLIGSSMLIFLFLFPTM